MKLRRKVVEGFMRRRNFKQKELAHVLNCSVCYVSYLLNGKKKPSRNIIERLMLITGYTFNELFKICLILAIFSGVCLADTTYSDERIVNAIYRAEGGDKAQYPYGIRSLKYEDRADKSLSKKEWARKICFNTVRNNRKRFAKQAKYSDFISFLGSRYCPVGCDNDTGTNKYWIKNVKYFLEKD